MNKVLSFERLTHLTPLVWVMLIGNFFVRGAFYMVWPFLAVMLYQKYHLSASEVGLLLSGSAVFAVLLGFYTGNLADRFGRMPILFSAILIGIVAFIGLSYVNELMWFCVFLLLATLPRSLWDAPSKALLSDQLDDVKDRELALQLLYFLVNVGTALGPLIGVWAGLNGQQESFIFTALAYLGMAVALLCYHKKQLQGADLAVSKQFHFGVLLRVLRKDYAFLSILAANGIIFLVYAQGDTSLIQYLTRSNVQELATLISSMIILNATVIVLFQFPLIKLMEQLTITVRLYCGVSVLFVSQLMFAFNPVDYVNGWLIATFVLSIGEAILFSNVNVFIDKMAPAHLKASYFGAASLCSLGFALAPIFGGIILDVASGQFLFIITSMMALLSFVLYYKAQHQSRPDFSQYATVSER